MHPTATPEEIYSNLSMKPNKSGGLKFGDIIRESRRWYKAHYFFLILSWILLIRPRELGCFVALPPSRPVRGWLFCQDKARASIFRQTPGRFLGSVSRSSNCRSWGVAKYFLALLPQARRTCTAHCLQVFVLAKEGRALCLGPVVTT